MITSNSILRTFALRCRGAVGTGFVIDHDRKQYLISARHVVHAADETGQVEVLEGGAWSPTPVVSVGHGPDNVDISVLAPRSPLVPENLPITASSEGLVYGQDLYFLGFPFAIYSTLRFGERLRPLPFAKRAILSMMEGELYLLDGHNNPGFSGGPVVFSSTRGAPDRVAAVISGYRFHPEPVYEGDSPTALHLRQNTGIIYAYRIESALELIARNPIGAQL